MLLPNVNVLSLWNAQPRVSWDPGPNHLEIFERLCRESGATGKLVADAQHAAVAVEHGCTMVSTDSDFARFPGLRWQHPLRSVGM